MKKLILGSIVLGLGLASFSAANAASSGVMAQRNCMGTSMGDLDWSKISGNTTSFSCTWDGSDDWDNQITIKGSNSVSMVCRFLPKDKDGKIIAVRGFKSANITSSDLSDNGHITVEEKADGTDNQNVAFYASKMRDGDYLECDVTKNS